MRQGEGTIELLLRKVKESLTKLNQICFICMSPLGKSYAKMRTCGKEMCEFRFEENNLGNIFNEIKNDPDTAHFLVETAYMAFASGRAGALTEPFPGFLLKAQEIRAKTGDLEAIRLAKADGNKVETATKTDHGNKEIEKGVNYIKIIYSVIQEINLINTEMEFRNQI